LGSTVAIEDVRPDLSEFGKHVYGLMLSRGITNFSQLCATFLAKGDKIHRQTLSGYVKGSGGLPADFGRRLAMALDLTEDEERELAWLLYKHG
jgi:hypothetical protein